MKYIKSNGTNNHLIIALHGTGGSADSLFDLANSLDSKATKIGFQGTVLENGMRRYFARYPDGSFDLPSLKKASKDLHNSINRVIAKYKLENNVITILGYSNGANMAKDLFKEYKNVAISHALLFHPSLITPTKEFKEQKDLDVFMTSGQSDPYITSREFKELETKMTNASMHVETLTHQGGHQLVQEEIDQAKSFLFKRLDQSND